MKAIGGSLLDLFGLGLVVAGAWLLFGIGVALVLSGAACLLVSFRLSQRRPQGSGSEVA